MPASSLQLFSAIVAAAASFAAVVQVLSQIGGTGRLRRLASTLRTSLGGPLSRDQRRRVALVYAATVGTILARNEVAPRKFIVPTVIGLAMLLGAFTVGLTASGSGSNPFLEFTNATVYALAAFLCSRNIAHWWKRRRSVLESFTGVGPKSPRLERPIIDWAVGSWHELLLCFGLAASLTVSSMLWGKVLGASTSRPGAVATLALLLLIGSFALFFALRHVLALDSATAATDT